MYPNPIATPMYDSEGNAIGYEAGFLTTHFEDFYEDVYLEFSKYGKVQEINICDNIGKYLFKKLAKHLVGNVYVKFFREEDAAVCVKKCKGRYYAGRLMFPENSPVTNFRDARCKQFETSECTRGGICNFMHLKKLSKEYQRELYQYGNSSRKYEDNYSKDDKYKFKEEKYGNDKYMKEEKYGGNDKYIKEDKYSNEKYGDNKYMKEEKYGGGDKYSKEDKYGGGDKYSNEKYGDNKYMKEEKYGNDKYVKEEKYGGGDKYSKDYKDDKYGVDKYSKEDKYGGGEKYSSKEKYGNDKYMKEDKYSNEKYGENKYVKEEKYGGGDKYSKEYKEDKYGVDKYSKEDKYGGGDKYSKEDKYKYNPKLDISLDDMSKKRSRYNDDYEPSKKFKKDY
jgi:hypothetical protein